MKYSIPDIYYFRIHHIRPRFKNDVENVLFFISAEIAKISESPYYEFKRKLNEAISLYPGNITSSQKTIDNWRTEISALFGLIQRNSADDTRRPSTMAIKLADEQDLVQFFKYFLYYFQYPGGHLKKDKCEQMVKAGIHFKPAQYILRLLEEGESISGKRFGINKAETAHCVFNDLRVTRDNRNPKEVVSLIIDNQNTGVEYDWQGDTIRYAGDILDYMVLADLLTYYPNGKYYINWKERESVIAFIESTAWFNDYYTYTHTGNLLKSKLIEENWFDYVNIGVHDDIFKTDVLKYLNIEENTYSEIVNSALEPQDGFLEYNSLTKTKEIGDFGESLVIGHESMRLKIAGKTNLIHLIKKIPTHFAIGYDVQSVELNEMKRLIEVKTTISSKPLSFYSFHLTTNEWNAAQSYGDLYFVYRLMISKEEKKLFIINNPIKKYKEDLLKMTPREGADINFTEKSGNWEELLIWKI